MSAPQLIIEALRVPKLHIRFITKLDWLLRSFACSETVDEEKINIAPASPVIGFDGLLFLA